MEKLDWADDLAIDLMVIARDQPFVKARAMIAAKLRSTFGPPLLHAALQETRKHYESNRALQDEHRADRNDAKRDRELTDR